MPQKPRERTVKEYRVSKVEFFMGTNDITDIKAGGPSTLSFWFSTNLPKQTIEKVAQSPEIQRAIKSRGGDGTFKMHKVWAESFVATEEEFKIKCLELVKQF